MVAFVRLGQWQLDVARSAGATAAIEKAAAAPAVPLGSVLRSHQPFPPDLSSRRVTVAGTYAEGQVLVADRRLSGRDGWWVVTPLRVEGGGTVGVLRGFVADPGTAPAAPAGRVDVAGTLAPSESPVPSSGLPEGRLASVDLSVLVQRWPGELYNAFVFATAEAGPGVPADLGLVRVPPPPPVPEGLTWRNLAYALQWWLFAAFAGWMWVRMVRDEAAAETAAGAGADTGPGTGGDEPARLGENGRREPPRSAEPLRP